jgi:hypothetical protein
VQFKAVIAAQTKTEHEVAHGALPDILKPTAFRSKVYFGIHAFEIKLLNDSAV